MFDDSKVTNITLDPEEKELLDSIEQEEWKTSVDAKSEAAFAKKAATNYLHKDARVNIRISSSDLMLLKQKAAYKGLPYQTLVASVLHEYAAGHFDETR